MVKRLQETYAVGETVEITFDGRTWLRGRVVAHEPPAVWVQTADGRSWFVTNTRRIRPVNKDPNGQ